MQVFCYFSLILIIIVSLCPNTCFFQGGKPSVVEAMSSHRPYRPALGIEQALKEIKTGKGKLYDPEIVDICIDLFKNQNYKLH